MTILLSAHGLQIAAGAVDLLRALQLNLEGGQLLAVLGRNGAGKSLLLHTLAGLRRPTAGTVQLRGQDLAQMRRRDIARQLGFLPQDSEAPPQVLVHEWVMGGRYAHGEELRWPTAEDQCVVMQALARVQLTAQAQRWLPTLSGGEQRRAALATLLAQNPAVMLLDEPTNHLDPKQIAGMMQWARETCAAGTAVVMTLHDPQLAYRWADQVLLLQGDGNWQLGPTRQLLTAATLSRLYDTTFVEIRSGERNLLLQD